MLVTQRVSQDALFHELDGRREAVFRIGDCVAPRLLAEVVFDGHRLAREIDGDDPEVALPYLRERVGDSDEPAAGGRRRRRSRVLPPRPAPARRTCEFVDDRAAAAERIDALLRTGGSESVVAVGAGAGDVDRALPPAGRAPRRAPRGLAPAGRGRPRHARRARGRLRRRPSRRAPTWRFGISGALPHLVGMDGSATVVAVDRDRTARIFEHADLGVTADAGEMIDALLALAGDA